MENQHPKYYGYVRVSTSMQVDDGLSLENQRKKIEAWGIMNDQTLIKIYADEGISGRSMTKRDGLAQVLKVIKEGETLVVYSFSRLARSVQDFLHITMMLQDKGCQLAFIVEKLDTSTAMGKFTAHVFAALAQLESDMTSERVKDAMQYKISKGEFVGRPPYGWNLESGKGSNLIPVEHEQIIIRKIKAMREIKVNGKQMSYQKIADRLNKDGVSLPGNAKKWYHSAVSRICARKSTIVKGRRLKDSEIDKIKEEQANANVQQQLDVQIAQIDKVVGYNQILNSQTTNE